MALRTPPSWLQQGSHTAENDRLSQQALLSNTGVVGSASLLVTQNSTPAMNVNIADGWASIVSSTNDAGVYTIYNDATQNVAISAADATNPRKDIVVATVNDAYYSGSTNNVVFQVIAGTPAVSPTQPATPSNSILLAVIAVAANATSIVTANITDSRTFSTSLVSTAYTYSPAANVTLANSTAVQSLFGVGLSLPAGTYTFDANLYIVKAVTTTCNISVGWATSAGTIAGVHMIQAINSQASAPNMNTSTFSGGASFISFHAATSTLANNWARYTGTFRLTAAATVTPQMAFSAAPGTTNYTALNSNITITPVGGNLTSAVGSWA